MTISRFAEIHVFEASLGYEGQMVWNEITSLTFDRDYLGLEQCQVTTNTTACTDGRNPKQHRFTTPVHDCWFRSRSPDGSLGRLGSTGNSDRQSRFATVVCAERAAAVVDCRRGRSWRRAVASRL